MKPEVTKDFFNRKECALIARNLFDRRALWESRTDRKVSYRNGDWFTVGSSLYLDLKSKDDFEPYRAKVKYWNEILTTCFNGMLAEMKIRLRTHFGVEVDFLKNHFEPAGLPGFHIFGPEETNQSFFGKRHQDRQWQALILMPGFSELFGFQQPPTPDTFLESVTPWSITIPILLPFLGGGMEVYEGAVTGVLSYNPGDLILHDGLGDHAIAPYAWPVLPTDWRISIQAHGLEHNGALYLYW